MVAIAITIIMIITITIESYITYNREDTSCIKYGMSVAVKAPAAKER